MSHITIIATYTCTPIPLVHTLTQSHTHTPTYTACIPFQIACSYLATDYAVHHSGASDVALLRVLYWFQTLSMSTFWHPSTTCTL